MAVTLSKVHSIQPARLVVVPRASGQIDLMSRMGAQLIAGQLQRKPHSVLGLATGSTPLGTYRELIEMSRSGRADFSKVSAFFNLDEYVGVPEDFFDQTYLHYMTRNFFGPLEIPKSRIKIPYWKTQNPEYVCAIYEKEIERAGGIDLQLMGLGPMPSPHVGFNEAGTPIESLSHVVRLESRTRIANSRNFMTDEDRNFLGLMPDEDPIDKLGEWSAGQKRYFKETIMPRVPSHAMTMGIGTILKAQSLLMLANKATKATALQMMLTQNPSQDIPASLLRFHPLGRFTIIADEDAASLLPILGVGHYWVTPDNKITMAMPGFNLETL
jgi:glucosamine-6-phosphate deaminase